MSGEAKSRVFGSFELSGGWAMDCRLDILACRISNEKLDVVEIKKQADRYVVSSLDKNQIPEGLVTACTNALIDHVDLYAAASSLDSEKYEKVIFEKNENGRSYRLLVNHPFEKLLKFLTDKETLLRSRIFTPAV